MTAFQMEHMARERSEALLAEAARNRLVREATRGSKVVRPDGGDASRGLVAWAISRATRRGRPAIAPTGRA